MDLASELAPFSPSPELVFWAENRVGGLLEQVKTSATEIHWRDAKIEKLTLEPAVLISNPGKAAVGVGWRTRIGRLGR